MGELSPITAHFNRKLSIGWAFIAGLIIILSKTYDFERGDVTIIHVKPTVRCTLEGSIDYSLIAYKYVVIERVVRIVAFEWQ